MDFTKEQLDREFEEGKQKKVPEKQDSKKKLWRESVFWAVLGFLILCAGSSAVLWQLLFESVVVSTLLTVVVAILLVGLIWQCAKNDIFFTILSEARARIILKGGQYIDTIWLFRDHVELENGFILDQKHLFPPEAVSDEGSGTFSASARDQSLVELKQFDRIAPGETVAYKVNTTKKRPKTSISKEIFAGGVGDDGEPKKTVLELSGSQVYLDRVYNFMGQHAESDLSLDVLIKRVEGTYVPTAPDIKHVQNSGPDKYPKDFFDRIDRGFYAKNKSTDASGKEVIQIIPLSTEDVLVKVVEHVWRSARIKYINHGNRQLFGGVHWVGFPGVYSLFRYNQNWVSLKPDGTTEDRDTKKDGVMLIDILLSDDIYLIQITDAEDVNLVPLDIKLLAKMRIVNPRLAMFITQKVLENVSSLTGAIYRQMISGFQFEQIIREKTKLGQSWWGAFELEMCNPYGEHFFERNGMWVKSTEVWSVEVSAKSEAKKSLAETQVKVWTAQKTREAAIIEAEGIAKSVEIVAKGKANAVATFYTSLVGFGDQGLQILFMQTLEQLGKDPAKVIIPFGSIQDFIRGSAGTNADSKMQALFAEIAKAGITPAVLAAGMKDMLAKKEGE